MKQQKTTDTAKCRLSDLLSYYGIHVLNMGSSIRMDNDMDSGIENSIITSMVVKESKENTIVIRFSYPAQQVADMGCESFSNLEDIMYTKGFSVHYTLKDSDKQITIASFLFDRLCEMSVMRTDNKLEITLVVVQHLHQNKTEILPIEETC